MVLTHIGNVKTADGDKVKKAFADLVGVALPLSPVPDLAVVRDGLLAQFPYATSVVDAVLRELVGQCHVRLPPIILVGSQGAGKTAFAEGLLDALGVPRITVSCGGVGDAALAGTSRRWSSGEPCLPMAQVLRWRTATPGIVLDEVEKVASSRHNGSMLDALLGFLEPRSAKAWHDPYVEAPVDLSGVIWLATANSVGDLPGPLRDRCRILAFPEPRPEHLEVLAPRLLKAVVTGRGLDERWGTPLDAEEFAALGKFWRGGSIRRLRRLIEGVLDARGGAHGVQ